MDNITHSLFGYALGRACAPARAGSTQGDPVPALERALLATGVLASNAPDLDFLTSVVGDERRLRYLLDHRGFTHTLIFGLVLGAVVGLGCALALRVRAPRERLAVCGLGALSCLFHIGFDFLNDYGVHPFFPFDNHWYYGDSLFIVEPTLIAVLLPLPMFFAWSRLGRAISGALALGLVLLVWLGGPGINAVGVSVVLFGASWLQRRLGARALATLAATAAIVAAFVSGSQLSAAQIRRALHAVAPTERVLDLASIPVPGNPTCFRGLLSSLDDDGMYRARVVRSQLFGAAASCKLLLVEPSAPLAAAELPPVKGVEFESVFAAPAAELAMLAYMHCDAAAMLKFIRIPFWDAREGHVLLGDLRYDRSPALEFAERLLTGVCKGGGSSLRPWLPPRADLLKGPQAKR